MKLFKGDKVEQQTPNYEHYAGMDPDNLPPEVASDWAIKNAIIMSRQALLRRAARQEQPQQNGSRLRNMFERIIRSRRSRFAGMALIASLAVTSVLNSTDRDSSIEAAFQPSSPVPTMPETTTTTRTTDLTPLEGESSRLLTNETIVASEEADTIQTSINHQIIIPEGGTLWWEIDGMVESSGLSDSDCKEVATRGIIYVLREQTGQDLNYLQPGLQNFELSQEQIDNQIAITTLDQSCSPAT